MRRPVETRLGSANVHLRAATEADAQAAATILIRTRAEFMPYAPAVHSEAEIRDWVRAKLIPGGGVVVAVDGFLARLPHRWLRCFGKAPAPHVRAGMAV